MTEASPWLTIDEAADRLKVSPRTVERMVEAKRLPEYRWRPGGGNAIRRYHVADVDAAMKPTTND